MLTGQNGQQSLKHYQQEKNVFWQGFADYALLHPEILDGLVSDFFMDAQADIFRVFPIKITKQAKFFVNEIRMDPVPLDMGTRKVPNRIIHFKTSTRSASALYTGQGFQIDYAFLRTPDGMDMFDRMLNAVISDIWCMLVYNCMKEFQAVPSGFCQPDQLYPYDEMPVHPWQVFEYERHMWGVLNKAPQAIQHVIAHCNRIYERNNSDTVARILVTQDCAHFVNVRDETNLTYDKSGYQALKNRTLGNQITSLHNVETIAVQMLEPTLHSAVHDNVLRDVVMTGGMASFVERGTARQPREYKSRHRNLKMSSWTSNRLEEYNFLEFLKHCPEFVPLDSTDAQIAELEALYVANGVVYDAAQRGHINALAVEGLTGKFSDVAKATKCTNIKKIHPFINTALPGSRVRKWVDMHACNFSDNYRKFVLHALSNAIASKLSKADIKVLQTMTLIHTEEYLEENEQTCANLGAVLHELFKDNNWLVGNTVTKTVHELIGRENVLFYYKAGQTGSNGVTYNADTYVKETRDRGPINGSIIDFIANQMFDGQVITLNNITAWYENDIPIPLGGSLFRPFETQFMESMVTMATGEVGNMYFSGIDNIIDLNRANQHFSVQLFCHFRPMIENKQKFYVMPFTRGQTIIGGKGNKYVTSATEYHNTIAYGTPAWGEMMEHFGDAEKMADNSIIPVLQSYTESVEANFSKRHIDIRGFWDPADFQMRLHVSPDFRESYDTPMYDGQYMTNFLYPTLTANNNQSAVVPIDKASFNEYVERRRVNYHLHQTTQYVMNPATNDWEKIRSSHYWGEEEDGIVEIQNSTSAVRL